MRGEGEEKQCVGEMGRDRGVGEKCVGGSWVGGGGTGCGEKGVGVG